MRIIGAGHRDDIEYRVLDTFWTAPNLITVARFLLVPLFVWLVWTAQYGWATAVLAFLGSTDWVDGYVARRFNQISTVGRWLDPLADRVSLIVVAATIVLAGLAPAWLVYAIVVPDLVLIINSLVLFRGSPDLPVTTLGKVRTAMLLAGTPLLLFGHVEGVAGARIDLLATVVLAAACALHVIAAVQYFIQARKKAKVLRAGEACPG
ncbi:CDP-alcohol phosphatidyltransferase family protein [Zafaria cholistanensis]|uniref:CDP-alcohol phosphatidyltransferase family protein n=1 Tax=Zafaria cholistanensis TaxID=1682741 RepID=UPI0012311A54|nr:CDP-alcohol phosphatidyltransferase family protein [Zafaria cholistanensis]